MDTTERTLLRWQRAGLLDEATAGTIRAYERGQVKPAGQQWQVRLALILGGILLGAGVLLFVAAHWDRISPASRTLLVLAMVVFAHGLGMAVQGRFAGLATAMHAIGTVTAGAAIALVGQIYNMQEHWPAAVLLWALCAAAGWALLGDEFQQTLTLLLVPAWVMAEWADRAQVYGGDTVYLARVGAVLGVVYLVAFLRSRRRATFGSLFSVGALLLPISISFLADGWSSVAYGWERGFVPMGYQVAAVVMMVAIGVCGALVERDALLPAVVVGGLVWALPWCRTIVSTEFVGQRWEHGEMSVLAYALVAAAAIFLVWWGVQLGTKALVNYGTVAFAMTVFWFYFASVMDKLGRSLGLMALGVLFLGGGWALERGRRRLVSGMEAAA